MRALMKKFYFLSALLFFFASQQVAAHEKVVVIPLSGNCDECEEATGLALERDVRRGRTFSNSWSTGLTGTRPPAPVARTGQTSSRATGDDGDLKNGIFWPIRFTEGDSVVIDNLTELMWQKVPANEVDNGDWSSAIDHCNELTLFANNCIGCLGWYATDWRLPNINELLSLVDRSSFNPALPALDPFINVKSVGYWTSTAYPAGPDDFWVVDFTNGSVAFYDDTVPQRVWCVRGGYTGL